MYDHRVLHLKTPEECESFAKNAERLGHPELAQQARRRAVELRAAAYGANSDAEREALEAIYAVEEILSQRNGRKTRASRTWQSIKRHGILQTVERVVSRRQPTDGYTALVEMGMDDFTFEAVVLRHRALFQPETIERAKTRIAERKGHLIE
jgi:hypothetical protein